MWQSKNEGVLEGIIHARHRCFCYEGQSTGRTSLNKLMRTPLEPIELTQEEGSPNKV